MSNEPTYVPTLKEATADELIAEMAERSTGLLVVQETLDRGTDDNDRLLVVTFKRVGACGAIGMADYAKKRICDDLMEKQ